MSKGPSSSGTGGRSPVALALAGGGPLGAIYEIGALNALSEALDGVDLNHLDQYVGVSAGAFITAGLANGITPGQLARMFIDGDSARVPFEPDRFLMPAWREIAHRARLLPRLAAQGMASFLGSGGRRSVGASLMALTRALPAGLFDNAGIGEYLREVFAAHGGSDDFRQLKARLFLVATELDTGEAAAFGARGLDHIPISQAISASAALPGLFPPVRIEDRWYVDGALKKTLHASVALREGAKLVLCVNPLVPFDARRAPAQPEHKGLARDDEGRPRELVRGGLPTVMAQTFRAMIHSRMEVGLARYELEYPDADVILFEPDHGDADMFFTNLFSYSSRQRLCEHAYQQTRKALWARREELGPKLERHGVRLREEVLREERSMRPAMARLQRRRSGSLGRTALELDEVLGRLEGQLRAGGGVLPA